MRRTMLLLSGVTVAVFVGRPLVAQTLSVSPGARVRVMTASSKTPYIGVAESVSDTMISIANRRDTTRIPIRAITGIDVSLARKRPMWSKTAPLWLTAAAGATGAVLGYATTPSDDFLGPEFGAAAGGALGGILGLLVGTSLAFGVVHDTWEPVEGGVHPRSTAAPALFVAPRGSGLAFGLHATF